MTLRVLYIDDDRINSLLFVEACRLAPGVEVETAGSGAEALQCLAQWRPDLLVVDLHLPDTNGCALLPLLRSALDQPALPAYLCTADDTPETGRAAKAAGFDGCWTKPVELPLILAELARRGAALAPPPAESGTP